MAKILGLDLGTNSIGWAITEQNGDGYTLLDKGVDIFQKGVLDTKSGEEPMVKTRTDKRALRRHYYRRRLRKIELLKVLIDHDMCPPLSQEELDLWRYKKLYPQNEEFLLWQRTDDNLDKNPYHDRHIALTEELNWDVRANRHLIGRALYHLAQRRGFLSNRKDQSEEGEESGKVKEGISTLSREMKSSDCEYIGDYFYHLYAKGESVRGRYTDRKEHFEKEFNAICEKQSLPNGLKSSLHRAIFFQRPLRSQKGLVGKCTFEKGKARCPISHPRFEEFRMWCFINNIRIKVYNEDWRALNEEEITKALPMFFRKSKPHFDFEDIAKAIAGKKKGSYAAEDDKIEAPYRFNFRMTTSVSGCPVTAQLMEIFGQEWLGAICEQYTKGEGKTQEQILDDVWHALFFFDSDEKLNEWAQRNLQLNEAEAEKFTKIKMPQDYASLSLCAINKILTYLREGFRYDESVFVANLSKVVPATTWDCEAKRKKIIDDVCETIATFVPTKKGDTKEDAVYRTLLDNGLFGDELKIDNLYHPSMIETYPEARPNADGIRLLGSPRTSSVRNPMAMRALFRLRALVNQLLREGKIDNKTKINIEFARGLNNANKRKAIEQMQREKEKKHDEYKEAIRKLYKEQCGADITPTDDDVLKYQLWVEQNNQCLYTGKTIRICDFIGAAPLYDIEHTVPRSRGGDNSQMNKTLCECHFNRDIKKGKLPSELANHSEVMAHIEELGWNEKCKELQKQIERTKGTFSTKEIKDRQIQKRHRLTMELDYWRGKLQRFSMTEVPEGFSNRQGVDIGIIGRYARLYLQSAFERVYIVKGATTADFRKAWGLQDEYAKKERTNHIHHCIDAITIACIGGRAYQQWAEYVRELEYYERGHSTRPNFPKPWATFTEDVKAVAEELFVSHHTANNMSKPTKKKVRVRGKIQYNENGKVKYMQGDTARGSLHKETYYGAILRDDEVKYVVRKALSALQPADVEKIVDDAVRQKVQEAIKEKGFKEAMSEPICFNEEKGVYIKKVRIFTPTVTSPINLKAHRDISRHEHKQCYHVANDSNYCMAIYEGEVRGKIKRSFEIVSNLDAALFYNGKSDNDTLVPRQKDGLHLKYILRTGTMVLFYETSPEEFDECTKADLVKRLYKVTGFSTLTVGNNTYGRLTFKHHQEARSAGELKVKNGAWTIGEEYRPVILLLHSQLNILVEGYDFELTVTGEIKFKHKF